MLYSAKYYLSCLFLYWHGNLVSELVREIEDKEIRDKLDKAYATIIKTEFDQFVIHHSSKDDSDSP